jgi:hypothetical protein
MLKLNVVTVVRNDEMGLRRTLKSLLSLAKKGVGTGLVLNIHIQDGQSVDATALVFGEYKDSFSDLGSLVSFVSVADVSLFDAMNKASQSFQPESLVLYLNAGDVIADSIDFSELSEALEAFNQSDSKMAAFRSINIWRDTHYYMPSLSCSDTTTFRKWIRSNTPVHQAIIFKTDPIFPIHYVLEFEVQADTLLIYYLIKHQGPPLFYNLTLCEFELGGLSNTYISFNKVLVQIKEQGIIAKLRGESVWISKTRTFTLIAKYCLHNCLGDSFYSLHAKINSIIRN